MVKHTQTIRRRLPTNCLSVFDHFVALALKGLTVCGQLREFIGSGTTSRKRKLQLKTLFQVSVKNFFQTVSTPTLPRDLLHCLSQNCHFIVTTSTTPNAFPMQCVKINIVPITQFCFCLMNFSLTLFHKP